MSDNQLGTIRNNYQIETIRFVMGFTEAQAKNLIKLMDETGDYPDWSEESDYGLCKHFKIVLLDNAIENLNNEGDNQ